MRSIFSPFPSLESCYIWSLFIFDSEQDFDSIQYIVSQSHDVTNGALQFSSKPASFFHASTAISISFEVYWDYSPLRN